MYKKKLINLALASLLPMSSVLMAEEPAAAQPAAEPAPAVAAAPESEAAPKAAAPAEKSSAEPEAYGRMTMEERWKAREQRYEDLKKRAEEAGVMLPESPPWQDRKAMMRTHPEMQMQKRMEHRKKMQSMTPEERDAYRLERYQDMRQRAEEIGIDLPETPPWKDLRTRMDDEWAKQQEVINGMTDEERAACHAMHRRHMQEMGPGPGPMNPMMRGQGMYPPPAYEAPAQGYGYGPYPYGPRGNYWEPNQ
jgi:hypothetical protein